ncbi:MAG: MBL fold metallo-hydrolase [Chloroflexi bacterium]|nr:MBL fold metallo-hydrolase [Chloroflexota bacterium]
MFIHTVRSRIANIHLLESGSGVVIVDAGFGNAAPLVLRTLDQLGYSPRDVRLIFLTHAHIDHVGSAAELRRLTGAPISLHRADVAKARAGKHNMPTGRGASGKILEHAFNGLRLKFRYEAFEPDVLFDDGQTLCEFGLDARVVHTPGHTLGSLSLVLEHGAMVIGDAVINQIRVGMPLYGEAPALAYDSARKILGMRPRILYSGHGEAFAGDALARYFELKGLTTTVSGAN